HVVRIEHLPPLPSDLAGGNIDRPARFLTAGEPLLQFGLCRQCVDRVCLAHHLSSSFALSFKKPLFTVLPVLSPYLLRFLVSCSLSCAVFTVLSLGSSKTVRQRRQARRRLPRVRK